MKEVNTMDELIELEAACDIVREAAYHMIYVAKRRRNYWTVEQRGIIIDRACRMLALANGGYHA
ncbi:MAG: hypothetical protein WC710_14085 [Gallionella sp.]